MDAEKCADSEDLNSSDTRLDNPETEGAMDVNYEVESEMKQNSETRTNCPIQDGDGKTVDAEKCADTEDLNSSDTRLDNPETEGSMDVYSEVESEMKQYSETRTDCPIQDGDGKTVDAEKCAESGDLNSSDTRPDITEIEDSMDVNYDVESEMKQYSETRTDCPIQDGDGKTVDAEKCAESEDLNSSDTRLDNPATETKQCEVEFRHPLLVQNNSEKEDNYFEEDGDEVCGFEKQSEVFFVGRKFSSMSELETAKKVYEDSHYFELWKRDVRTLTSAAKRVPKKVAKANQDLKYYSLRLTCKFGGKAVESGKERKRKTKSFRQGCPFEVYIALSEDGKYLQVNRISKQHNHALKKQIYERLPRQRAARCKNVAKDIEDAIQLQANPQLLKEKIENATGKRVTLKDISNIKQNSMKHLKKNDLEDVIEYLKKQPGTKTDIVVDVDNNFKGLFFQDDYMEDIYAHFPEILLVDATYKLLDPRMPVYLLMCIDGDRLSEIVAMFIVAEETKDVIQASVDLFKKHNPSWDKTKVIMSDNDFTERDAFKACFPTASLSICLYHTLRSFRREITCEKMGISSAERSRVLEILSEMAHSKSSGQYEKALDELKKTNIRSVIEYILENWHPINEQWVTCFKDKHLNLGETTNNRLESTFSKLKSVCSRYASLLQFCSEFMSVLKCLREERNHHYVMAISRRQTGYEHFTQDLQKYSQNLTPYAFKFVQQQYDSAVKVRVIAQKSSSEFSLSAGSQNNNRPEPHNASPTHCTCLFFSRMALPCKHIFKVRELVGLSAFDEALVHKRWTMDFYLSTNRLNSLPISHGQDEDHSVECITIEENKTNVFTHHKSSKKAFKRHRFLPHSSATEEWLRLKKDTKFWSS